MHTAIIENYLFEDSIMKQPNYWKQYYIRLCRKKGVNSKKTLIEIQFDRIGEFDEKIRKNIIAKSHPEIFKSPFLPCNKKIDNQ